MTSTPVANKELMMAPHRPAILLRALAILPTLALLSGCAGQHTTRTGFISSYDGTQPTKSHSADLIFVDSAYQPAGYREVFLDAVEWTPAPDTPPRNPEVIAQLKADFLNSLTRSLSRSFVIVAPPSPGSIPHAGVLRIRSAITNTRKANWWINLPVQVAGIGLSAFGLPGVPPPDPGGASEEMEALDAQSGKRVVAVATYNNGMPWNILGYYQAYGHARRAFDLAASLLSEQLHPRAVAVVSTDLRPFAERGGL